MKGIGWRTIVVQGTTKLSVRDGHLVLTYPQEEPDTVPLEEINRILLMGGHGLVTASLLREAAEHGVSVILCDKRYYPIAEFCAYLMREECAGAVMDQAQWTAERKDEIWAAIVRCKIENQIALLEKENREVPQTLREYLLRVEPGDPANRETHAARLYFPLLFGEGFIRHAPDAVNKALNYGYALLCSAFSRALTLYGYHPSLGIHHCGRNNKWNLSSDLMEPFRPFVDALVRKKRNDSFDWAYKRELIALFQTDCVFDSRKMSLDTAVEQFTLNTLKAMKDENYTFREVRFE